MRIFSESMKLLVFALVLLGCLQSPAAADFQAEALYEMRQQLIDNSGVLNDWKENQMSPCYWEHVTCHDNNVTTISLSSSGLTGTLSPSIAKITTLQKLILHGNSITGVIPQEFGNLSILTTLDLGKNNLNGSIPETLGRLPKLEILDLSQNHLSGSIPSSFLYLPSLNNINLAYNNLSGEISQYLLRVPQHNYTGNHLNCGQHLFPCEGGSIKTGGSKNSMLKVALGSIAGAITLLVLGVLFVLWWQWMRYRPEIFIDASGQLEFRQIKLFSWRELQIATNNFSEQNVLGRGCFGKVYKGVLPGPDNIKIAVKRLFDVKSPEGEMAFLREVELISIAAHKNILRLIGFCTTSTERLLVYPFMENLSVASRLRDIKLNEPALDWSTRMRIALGAARGLEYLHEHCNPKIIHCDVKAANILLDGNFEAVIGDFRLAKMMDIGRNTVTTALRGTMGHIAPEYIKTGRPSVKTDIFGYGVTLLEIVTGERAFASYPEAGEIMLIDRVKLMMEEGQLEAIADRNLGALYNLEELEKIIQIALLCTHMEPDHRPAMSELVQMLEGELVPAERWGEWQLAELQWRQQYKMSQQSTCSTIPGQNDHRREFGPTKQFSWREIQIATDNFSEQNVVGKGAYGKVYTGVLPGPDSTKIAVKRLLNVERSEVEKSFLREVESISIANHKNILSLIGFCTTPTEKLLVYPFMENLSVASRLRDIKLNEPALDWPTRMRIALGAARGLEYLHEHCNPKIIHRDVKAANVLLDGNFEAVVGDFGLAKMMDIERNTVTTMLRGTPGHIAPEYARTWRPSVKTDIFGYGAFLLEIVTGQRALARFPAPMEATDEIILIDQVKLLMKQGRLNDIVDRKLREYNKVEFDEIIQIAVHCMHMEPGQRPAMSEVVKMLEELFKVESAREELICPSGGNSGRC